MAKDIMTSLPVIGGFFDDTDEMAMEELKRNRRMFEGIQVPDLTWKDYAPELYNTESADFDLITEDPILRSNQMSLLNELAGLSSEGLSDADQAQFARARADGNQMARAGTEAAITNARDRGVGGAGMEFAMREIANQGGAERAQAAGLEQASTAAKQRALYRSAYGDQLGNVRGQDMNVNQANTNIINDFNRANTNQRNETAINNTQVRNDAQKYNNEGRTGTQQQNFDNNMRRAEGISGASQQVANGYAAQNAANTANRNMYTQIGANALVGTMGAKKKPTGNQAGQSSNDYSAYV